MLAARALLAPTTPCDATATEAMPNHYVTLARSGDCGHWDPETEDVVIQTRKALAEVMQTGLEETDEAQG